MRSSSRKALLVLSALLIIGEHVAVFLWLKQADGVGAALAQTWAAIHADWIVGLLLVDGAIFAVLVCSWLWLDLARLRATRRARAIWLTATLVFGSPSVLAYVALREQSVGRV